MKTDSHLLPQETELKLALSGFDPAGLKNQLAYMPSLASAKASHLHLHNTYYDTPEQTLRQKRVALRLRRVGSDAQAQWLQTLKMGGTSGSALSQRGEWEISVPGAALSLAALQDTPWPGIDPQGKLFRALTPKFTTSFDRTSWTVGRPDGSLVEVSLDIGQILAEGKSAPLCELELELLQGQPEALFGLAREIARSIVVLPEHRSKAERGYALAEDALSLPVRARPPSLGAKMSTAEAAQRVLQEMFCQFTANLNTLRHCDDPEVVHQARVGWRRFRSAYRLFKPVLDAGATPSWAPLKTLLTLVGELRDMDVARTETLPQLADAYTAGHASRQEKWQALTEAFKQAAHAQRKAVCDALEAPGVGASLLEITQWLEALPTLKKPKASKGEPKISLRSWARQRIARLHKKFKSTLHDTDTLESQHRIRIFSKRLRYGIEAFQPLLRKGRTKRWYWQATHLQTRIGVARDVAQASILALKLETDPGLAEFLRGVAAGQARRG